MQTVIGLVIVFIPIAILGYGVIRDIRQFNRDVSSVIDKSRL
jgi:hypothetical protein